MISLPIHTDGSKPCLRIKVTSECHLHNADVVATNDSTGEQEVVGQFRGLDLPGQYCFQVPDGYSDFKVNNDCGVIEAM